MERKSLKRFWSWEGPDPPLRDLVKAVRETRKTFGIGGQPSKPHLVLRPVGAKPHNVLIGIAEAQNDWEAVSEAALYLEARFGFKSRGQVMAVLERNSRGMPGALQYDRRSMARDQERKATEVKLKALRAAARQVPQELRLSAAELSNLTETFRPHFRDQWRALEKLAERLEHVTERLERTADRLASIAPSAGASDMSGWPERL
jgi:hypothetical protein